MPINILMPALSPTMEKGNLAKWLKKEGDKVKSGDVIAEIETDKATMEVEAVDEGTIAKIVVPEGTQDVAVNDVIAVMAGDGEDVKAAGAAQPAEARKPSQRPRLPSREARSGAKQETKAEAPKQDAAPATAPVTEVVAAAPVERAASQWSRPHVLLAAGAPSRQGSRHRTGAHRRFRPAWPHHRARRRRGQIRQGAEGAGRRARRRACDRAVDVGQADPRAVRAGQLRSRAA